MLQTVVGMGNRTEKDAALRLREFFEGLKENSMQNYISVSFL
jgi:hypothetical protein